MYKSTKFSQIVFSFAAVSLSSVFISSGPVLAAPEPVSAAKTTTASPSLRQQGEYLPLCGTAHLAMAAQNFRSMWRFANLNAAKGNLAEACAWYEQVLAPGKFLGGPALHLHPSREEVQYEYALALRKQGKIGAAEKLEREARPVLQRRQQEIARSLAEAVKKSAAADADLEKKYSTIVYLHMLANMDCCLREYDKAEPLYQQALSQSKGVDGKYDVVSLNQDYAVLLYWTGRGAEAEKL